MTGTYRGKVQWRFVDPTIIVVDPITHISGPLIYRHPINPDAMSTPWLSRQTQTMAQSGPGGGILALQQSPVPMEWTFGGVIRTQAHYDALLLWSKKDYPIQVTDHFAVPGDDVGRTWDVVLTNFEPEDRKPTPLVPWRLKYTMHALMLSGANANLDAVWANLRLLSGS